MRRIQILPIAAAVLAVTACGQQAKQSTAQLGEMADTTQVSLAQEGGPVTVLATCKDVGNGLGATVHPWRTHTKGATQVTWSIRPQNPILASQVERVDSLPWPFQGGDTLKSTNNQIVGTLVSPKNYGTYKYRLRIICPQADNVADTIVIDPDVIVDDASRPDTAQ